MSGSSREAGPALQFRELDGEGALGGRIHCRNRSAFSNLEAGGEVRRCVAGGEVGRGTPGCACVRDRGAFGAEWFYAGADVRAVPEREVLLGRWADPIAKRK